MISHYKMFFKINKSSQISLCYILLKKTSLSTCRYFSLGLYYNYSSPSRKVQALNKHENAYCGESRSDLKTYTLEEVGNHDTKEKGIWVTFRHGVYDITNFVDKHPGGSSKIMMAAGASIEPFWTIFANHNNSDIYSLLESMRIGNLSSEEAKAAGETDDPYANEPKRHKALKINGYKPFCAETPGKLLVESFHTPEDIFYVRNHLPVPEVELDGYEIELAIEEDTKLTLNLESLKKYPEYTVSTTIMCGGNRRSEMSEVKPLKGLRWDIGAVGTAKWTGARLCDILKDMGINEDKYNHVQFEGHDLDPSGTPYGASIPISKAMDPKGDVILAYKMNGRPIPKDHGFPVRAIVPGVVGARNVKWLAKVIVSKEECQSQFQQGDYKLFSPNTDWDTVDFSKSPAIQEMPVISAICTPEKMETIKVVDGKIPVKGYAWSGGGKKIIRVDVTCDNGDNWHTADIIAQDLDAKENRHWSWILWMINLPVDIKTNEIEIWSKAVDSSCNVQPESVKNIWNLRGFLCNSYHKIKVKLEY
ncbi:sulfite oxidase isoform X2 [Prorops nasuta]|uniref:sulfite oxidase isoform X2 n=1 Tax=Prorops nasuta TaxID=863751 RepID=UPI0034CFE439